MTRACRWWMRRHRWQIVKTEPVRIRSGLGITTFAWERCTRCRAARLHEFPGQWLDQYPRWKD